MPSAFSVGAKQTFQAIPKFYQVLFSKEYLGNATMAAQAARKSKARLVAGRVLAAVGMTAGAPVVLPVVIVRGIYKNTKAENARRAPEPPSPPVAVTAPPVPGSDQVPSSVEDVARKLFVARGVSEEGAAAMAASVYRDQPLPGLNGRDVQILTKIFDEDLNRTPDEIFNDEEIFSLPEQV